MTLPLATIVIPTHNRAALLEEAVDSALAQTVPVEVIVVDDGSTGETAQAIARYGARVISLRQENAGVSAARNRGLRAASAPFVSFLDDDDAILPEKIERQMAELKKRPEAGFVHCRHYYSDLEGNLLGKVGLLPEGRVLKELVCQDFIWMSAPLIRREALERVGGFDESLSTAADFDLWLRILKAGYSLACVQQPLGSYRIHPASMITNAAQAELEIIHVLDRFFSEEDLPGDVKKIKDPATARWRFWLAWRYYASGSGHEGRRNLELAAQLDPALVRDRNTLYERIVDEAIDLRTPDPGAFIEALAQDPPYILQGLRADVHILRSRASAALGVREIARSNTGRGQALLREAFQADPSMIHRQEEFARLLTRTAMNLPLEPQHYVREIFNCLPAELSALKHTQKRVESALEVALGFEDYHNGRKQDAFRRFSRGLLLNPAWVMNRGVVSALLKSLRACLPGGHKVR